MQDNYSSHAWNYLRYSYLKTDSTKKMSKWCTDTLVAEL